MEDIVCDEYIKMLGYRRIKKTDSMVINKVNGRPFSATDAEHFLCKAWVIAKYTLPNNTMAEGSKSTQPHCPQPTSVVKSLHNYRILRI